MKKKKKYERTKPSCDELTPTSTILSPPQTAKHPDMMRKIACSNTIVKRIISALIIKYEY